MSLADALTPGLAAFLASPPSEPGCYRGPRQLDVVMDRWGALGAELVELGESRSGQPIRAAVFGRGPQTMLAWGFPHPDEPLGSEALCWLGDALCDRRLPDLAGWRVALILCADPDEASRQAWFEHPQTMGEFTAGAWRPMKLPWMVDYGFPLDWGPFWQPWDFQGACRSRNECLLTCGPDGCRNAGRPPAPLPESLALAAAIDRYQPEVVASMHSTHTGGDYTFLLEREPAEVLDDLLAIPGWCGTGRHLGEPMDRGRHWLRDAPDLFVERGLAWFVRDLTRRPFYDPELVYHMNHSAAAYVQSVCEGAQFICPESTQFRHPDFSSQELLGEVETVQVSVEDRRRGRYELTRILVDGEWVVAHQTRAGDRPLAGATEREVAVTRGMLGVRALCRRRRALAAADEVWASVSAAGGLVYHPYSEERAQTTVPGAYVHDRSMLIFRTRPDYQRPASRAHAASFRWQWPAQTAALLGNFRSLLASQDFDRPVIMHADASLSALQTVELSTVPEAVRREGPHGPAMASMLARVMRVMLARG